MIVKEKGREGLHTQNLSDELVVKLPGVMVKITWIDARHPNFFDDPDIVKELRDEIKSLSLPVKLFTANNSPRNEIFNQAFRSLRYYYRVEKYRRDIKLQIGLLNVKTILNHPT